MHGFSGVSPFSRRCRDMTGVLKMARSSQTGAGAALTVDVAADAAGHRARRGGRRDEAPSNTTGHRAQRDTGHNGTPGTTEAAGAPDAHPRGRQARTITDGARLPQETYSRYGVTRGTQAGTDAQ